MTLVLTAALRMEAQQAKAELEATRRSVDGVKSATEAQARAARSSATATDADTAAKGRNRQAAEGVARANTQAAGATGNLVAQFNDIGMMLAAGQNPLQLAIQQGTQITQVIGPMGATGAVQALGAALMGMLSPINLVTLGVIGFGAAAIQSMMSTATEVDKVKELLDEVAEAAAGTQTEIDKLRFGVDEKYQVQLVQDQLALRREYTQKVAELNGYLATTTDNLDRQRITAAAMVDEIQKIVDRNAEIERALAEQQNRQTQLAIIEGIRAQQAGEIKARQAEAAAEAERMQRAITSAYETYARTRQEADELADAASRAGVSAESLSQIAFGNLAAASTEALRLAGNLGIALDVAERLAALGPQGIGGNDPSGNTYSGRGRAPTQTEIVEMRVTGSMGGWRKPPDPGRRGGAGGGRAAAARDEADALQELIDSLEAEIEALRVTDPIQQEMLQHRKALASATEEERQKVEALIAARERERAAMEAAQEMQEFFESTLENALDSLITKGESLNEVLKQIIVSLAKAVIQAALFGSGPFGGMFGGTGIGAMILGGKAEGGMVHGPGTGTSDSIPTMLSNGEYVVNARATQKNRHLLEAINAGGRIPGFAAGGYVGSDNRRAAGRRFGGDDVRITIDLAGARGDREIQAAAQKGTQAALREYDREALPASFKRVASDPRRAG